MTLRRRWVLPALLLCLTTIRPQTDVQAADEEPAVAETAPTEPVEVTDRVEVKLTPALRGTRDGLLVSSVVVRNTSAEDLQGRLVVVVDETGVAGVSLAANDGRLPSGENFVEVLPLKGTLKAGTRSTGKRIEFAAAAEVPAGERELQSPRTRVFQIGADDLAESLVVEENLPGKSYTQSKLNSVIRIQDKYTAQLMQHKDVFATATGEDDDGNLVVLVYTQRHGVAKELPGQVDGVTIQQEVTGTMFRMGPAWEQSHQVQPAAAGLLDTTSAGTTPIPGNPRARFDRPVPIGVSLFDLDDVCASGTLGCRIVFPNGALGVLTNSHVGSREGRNAVTGLQGDRWSQPGCGDAGGVDVPVDVIARLVDFEPYTVGGNNYIDAAVGIINSPNAGLVQACTPSDGYGFPSRTPTSALPRMRVMKYGRTTGFRRGTVQGINTTSMVAGSTGIFTYVHQVAIFGDNVEFGRPGDSGSLIVTEADRRPVALLFAGGGGRTLGNPINLVLDRFNVAIDDGTGTPPVQGPSGLNPSPGARKSGRMGGAIAPVVIP